MELEEAVPTIGNVEYYANIVREKAIKKSDRGCGYHTKTILERSPQIPSQLLDASERAIFDITQRNLIPHLQG